MDTLTPQSENTCVIPKAVKEAKTVKEYNRQLALWSIQLGLGLPHNLPYRPQALCSYDSMSAIERLKLTIEFWNVPEVKAYSDARDKALSHNYSAYLWLNNLLDYLEPGQDQKHLIEVRRVRTLFAEWFDANNRWLAIYKPSIDERLFAPDLHEMEVKTAKIEENLAIVEALNEHVNNKDYDWD